MPRRDIGTDDPRVRVRPAKGSRPRTKQRPDYSRLPTGMITQVNRGRYLVTMDSGEAVTAVKAREVGRGGLVVGDRVRISGEIKSDPDHLARIVSQLPRETELRRTTEDGEAKGNEKVIVANADTLLIALALADPPPRIGIVDRLLVAAYVAGMEPALCLTKADLASPEDFLAHYLPLELPIFVTSVTASDRTGLESVRAYLSGRSTVLVGHSGVGKSTLFNELVPQARRAIGHVNEVTGRGRHTSSSSVAYALPSGGYLIDTPGVRSFGLAHAENEDIILAFPDLAAIITECPKACPHLEDAPNCALDAWIEADENSSQIRRLRLESLRRLLRAQ